jgi:hypothetical protein
MGSVDPTFATDLRNRLGLRRAVETGTFRGITARKLAGVFPEVVTIELSEELHASAEARLRDMPQVRALQGHSAAVLSDVATDEVPSLYFLDGHWSGGGTEGVDDECPVLEELSAIGAGHPHDCLIVDDARLFTAAPPPPHDPAQWPTVAELFDAIRTLRPAHVVTVLDDQVIAVPPDGKPALDAHGQRVHAASIGLRERGGAIVESVRARVRR